MIKGDQKDTWKWKEWFANLELMEWWVRLARKDKEPDVRVSYPETSPQVSDLQKTLSVLLHS